MASAKIDAKRNLTITLSSDEWYVSASNCGNATTGKILNTDSKGNERPSRPTIRVNTGRGNLLPTTLETGIKGTCQRADGTELRMRDGSVLDYAIPADSEIRLATSFGNLFVCVDESEAALAPRKAGKAVESETDESAGSMSDAVDAIAAAIAAGLMTKAEGKRKLAALLG